MLLIHIFLTLALSEPETAGCSKDTDCKGERVCDAESRMCLDPEHQSVEDSETVEVPPTPVVVEHERPRFQYRTVTHSEHPYVGPGVALIFLGAAASAGGGLLTYAAQQRVEDASASLADLVVSDYFAYSEALKEFRDVSEASKKAAIGTGVLVSSGVVLLVTGIVLIAITEKYETRVRVANNGVLIRF